MPSKSAVNRKQTGHRGQSRERVRTPAYSMGTGRRQDAILHSCNKQSDVSLAIRTQVSLITYDFSPPHLSAHANMHIADRVESMHDQ